MAPAPAMAWCSASSSAPAAAAAWWWTARCMRGRNHVTGEWGHNPLPWPRPEELPGPHCWCGHWGCLETWVAGPSLARDCDGEGAHDASGIPARAAAGEARAQAALDRHADRLARGLAQVVNLLDPDVIVLGGGLSNMDHLYTALPALVTRSVFSDFVQTPIVRNKHGDSSGVRGAAWLWPADVRRCPRSAATVWPRSMRSRCAACDSARIVSHAELFDLTIAHIDCDAFYASVEKRDRPELAAKPVIVGGGVRGVVTAACYVARIYGVRSAMPMFKALKACPDAVVIRPDFAKYVAVGRQIRAMMARLTPLLQPLSIDEAVLDLAGTEALHGAPPAIVLARFAREVEARRGRHRLDRAGRQPAAGEDRRRPRQAARLRGDRRARGRVAAGARAGAAAARHRPGPGAPARRTGHHAARPSAGAERSRGAAPAGRRGSVAGRAAPAARTRAGSTRRARPSRSAPRPHSMPT